MTFHTFSTLKYTYRNLDAQRIEIYDFVYWLVFLFFFKFSTYRAMPWLDYKFLLIRVKLCLSKSLCNNIS